MTIMVVSPDGSPAGLSQILTHRGFSVTHSPTAAQAFERLDREAPELVVCTSERSANIEALAEARVFLAERPTLPIVLIVNGVTKEFVVDALRVGVLDVIDLATERERVAPLIAACLARAERLAGGRARVPAAADGDLQQLDRDQRAGRHVQMGMLPPSPMAIDRYRLRHKVFPSLLLSGDFVDYFRITDNHFVFYIADVSGHGASSAFVTVLLKNFSRRLRREYRPRMLKAPGEILEWLNRELLDNQIDKHVAICIGVVDIVSDVLSYANAGHFPPPILVTDGGARFLELTGKPIGLFRNPQYASAQESMAGHVSLYVVSDGVLELIPASDLAEKEKRLFAAAEQCHRENIDIWQLLELEARLPRPDDVSCLAVTKES
jgi:serine phosphatase RsbU (regulator of sigma subunit)